VVEFCLTEPLTGDPRLRGDDIESIGVVLSIFAITILLINTLAPRLAKGRQISYLKQELNSLKADEDIFLSFLKKQPHYEVSRDDSVILFGNPDAKLFITILSNPYCNPCAAMHRRIEKFLKDVGGQVCIQYILSSFGEDLEGVNKHLLAVGLEKDSEKTMSVFSGWFKKGKPEGEKCFEPLGTRIANPAVEAEFAKHRAWRERTGIRATPTLLVDGWQLPENYRLEHLRYFTDLDVNYD
jgi:hypothetical protein